MAATGPPRSCAGSAARRVTAAPRRAGAGVSVRSASASCEVVELVTRGLKNREIAEELYLSPKTVERHLARVFEKLHVTSRAALARAVQQAQAGDG